LIFDLMMRVIVPFLFYYLFIIKQIMTGFRHMYHVCMWFTLFPLFFNSLSHSFTTAFFFYHPIQSKHLLPLLPTSSLPLFQFILLLQHPPSIFTHQFIYLPSRFNFFSLYFIHPILLVDHIIFTTSKFGAFTYLLHPSYLN